MTDADWVDEELAEPKKKRGLPKWVWGCGCGCSIVLVILSVVLVVAAQRLMDPELQWPRLQERLWFEERPTDLELQMGMQMPFQETSQFTLVDSKGRFTAEIHDYGEHSDGAELELFFATEPDEVPMSLILPEDPEPGELELQGRTVRILRFSGLGYEPGGLIGPGVRIDISDGNHHRRVDLRSTDTKKSLTDEEVSEFFTHFDVWRAAENHAEDDAQDHDEE